MTEKIRSNGVSKFLSEHRSLAAVLFGALLICLTIGLGWSDSNDQPSDEDRNVEAAMVGRIQLDPLETGPKSEVSSDQSKGHLSNFAPQELEQLSSPFTKETVLELNEIVGRALNAVQEFDGVRRSSHPGGTRTQEYEKLSATARKAQSDMVAAGERLRESGEKYNDAIFAAMARFVNEVDKEIRSEFDVVEVQKKRAILN